jgi:hypothetical protein
MELQTVKARSAYAYYWTLEGYAARTDACSNFSNCY